MEARTTAPRGGTETVNCFRPSRRFERFDRRYLAVLPSWGLCPLDRLTLRPPLSRGLPFSDKKDEEALYTPCAATALQRVIFRAMWAEFW